jgi:hypothetical protein
MAIIEGGVRFPLHPFLRQVLNVLQLTPSQVTINFYRIVVGVIELKERYHLEFEVEDLFGLYLVSQNKVARRKYLSCRTGQRRLIRGLPDSDKYANDFVVVRGEFEFALGEFRYHPIPRVPGFAGKFRTVKYFFFFLTCLFFLCRERSRRRPKEQGELGQNQPGIHRSEEE